MGKYFMILLGCSLWVGVSVAYNADHGPFPDDAVIDQIPMQKMEMVELSAEVDEFKVFQFRLPGDADTIITAYGREDGFDVMLTMRGETVLEKTPFSEFPFFLGLQAYTADLNQDGITDYLVYSYSGGVGLNVGYCTIGMLLSDQGTYRLTSINTLFPDETDYVILEGKPCFINAAFYGEEECTDGNEHNFWIYNLLAIDGGEVRLENELYSDFPKVVWFSFNPNHKETTRLMERQKAELIKKAQGDIFWRQDAK